jgi:hypothetical protein
VKLVQIAINYLLFISAIGLFNYEVVAKSQSITGLQLPGWLDARKAEAQVAYRPATEIPPLDTLIHEGREAVVFYSRLLR